MHSGSKHDKVMHEMLEDTKPIDHKDPEVEFAHAIRLKLDFFKRKYSALKREVEQEEKEKEARNQENFKKFAIKLSEKTSEIVEKIS